MKRLVTLLMFAIITALSAYSQSILGIDVGESYSSAYKMLRDRFGYKVSEDGGNIELSKFEMGDFYFDYGQLFFQWSDNAAKFYKATFQKWLPVTEVESMKQQREALKDKLESKYSVEEFINDQGFKCYELLGEETNGVTMHGSIELIRGKGRDNIKRLYLKLYYFPKAEFIKENSDF